MFPRCDIIRNENPQKCFPGGSLKPDRMKAVKILLIYPSQLYAPFWGRINAVKPHMVGLFSFLLRYGIRAEVLDLENELGRPEDADGIFEFKEGARRLISGYDFDIAAISCYTSLNYLSSLMVAQICRSARKDCSVVVGGYHPSALPQDFIYTDTPFDFVVNGEGETALLHICRGGNKKNTERPRLIQGPALDLRHMAGLDWQRYPYVDPHRRSHIYLSRGCPYRCVFCGESSKLDSGRWRSYPVDEGISEIKRLISYRDPRQIGICDACFGFDKAWRRGLLAGLIKNKIDKILAAEMRVDLLDKDDIDLFSRLNFNVILGIESCSGEMLRIMGKSRSPRRYLERSREVISYMNKKGVPYKLYLIFNHPGETRKTYAATIEFLESIITAQRKFSGYIIAQNYAFFPGSHIHINLRQYEAQCGTVIYHREWWKERNDHNVSARDLLPSSDLYVRAGTNKYWEKDIAGLNRRIFEKMPPAVRAFWWEAFSKEA